MWHAWIFLFVGGNSSQAASDHFGSPVVPFFILPILFALACAAFIVAAIFSGIVLAILGTACVALVVVWAITTAVAFSNVALATLVWTRRPPLRLWMSAGWWGACTLVAGAPVAILFRWLPYNRAPAPRPRPALA